MPKPDAALLDPARYPFSCRIEPRFGDLDLNMHINNAALVGILEDARVRFHATSGYHAAMQGLMPMVASLAVEYLDQGFFPDPLTIHVAPIRLGRTSYTLNQLVTQGERAIAFAQVVMVCVNEGIPIEISAVFRESVKPWMLRE